ncbi:MULTISPECIES: hypothetical protein [Streptosporangium]|uniref:Uncharacterized protein n=1 Tax=Streptosporangium brasiliense TaxID=47480 RepID=A0ABT9R1T2_9ACTN|nr:hypothetical protein [Streptosporangium brasiliense]MDP9863184.1 hypothetical protein [Streptosporangium brasiliense]
MRVSSVQGHVIQAEGLFGLGHLAEAAAAGVDLDGLRSPSVAIHAVLALVFCFCPAPTGLAVHRAKGLIRLGAPLTA